MIVPVASVFSMPYIYQSDFASAGANMDATHTHLEKAGAVYDKISPAVRAPSQPTLLAATPVASSHSEAGIGTISSGQMQSRTVLVDQATTMISMLYPSGQLDLTLVAPSGRRIDPAVADADADADFAQGEILGGKMAAYSLRNAELGKWTVEVTATSGTNIDYAISAWNQDPKVTMMGGFARQSIATGEDLVLQAT